ncbi:S41 family peptidase [Aestuariibacter sp. A3R04]|uniref:S41 family peptidase n=1 Tax=Aestuariibacter sp. A3R04 TaxID=2841571 RepID=UPI001C0A5FEF|nr:S41 family peptidase [Aestuariibacter sp. A3R04]MBU3021671.1 S41 family peptidase [Aestuariibacter sp. A3R04]
MTPLFKHAVVAITTLLVVTACGSSHPDGATPQPRRTHSDYHGVWLAHSYGRGIQYEDDTLVLFDYTTDYCLKTMEIDAVSPQDMADNFTLSEDKLTLVEREGDHPLNATANHMIYEASVGGVTLSPRLPVSCENGMIARQGESGYTRNPERDLAYLYQTFDNYYVDFALTDTDWPGLYQNAIVGIDEDTSDEALFESISTMIAPLRDAHVSVTSASSGTFGVNNAPTLIDTLLSEFATANDLTLPLPSHATDDANNYIADALQKISDAALQYAEDGSVHTAGGDALVWFQQGGLGYLSIQRMFAFNDDPDDIDADIAAAETAMMEAMTDLASTDGLIVDVRLNNGGRDVIALAIARFLFAGEQHVYSKETEAMGANYLRSEIVLSSQDTPYTKPIILLTSASTVSAAEVFTLIMRSFPHVTIVGQPTQGALSDALQKQLPNGFTFTLANERYLSTDEEWFERTGIPVDINTEVFSKTQRENNQDHAIEVAVGLLTGEVTFP